jgi:hypothetical protein
LCYRRDIPLSGGQVRTRHRKFDPWELVRNNVVFDAGAINRAPGTAESAEHRRLIVEETLHLCSLAFAGLNLTFLMTSFSIDYGWNRRQPSSPKQHRTHRTSSLSYPDSRPRRLGIPRFSLPAARQKLRYNLVNLQRQSST